MDVGLGSQSDVQLLHSKKRRHHDEVEAQESRSSDRRQREHHCVVIQPIIGKENFIPSYNFLSKESTYYLILQYDYNMLNICNS